MWLLLINKLLPRYIKINSKTNIINDCNIDGDQQTLKVTLSELLYLIIRYKQWVLFI